MAMVEMRTWSPITTVPVRSLITTLASLSGSTSSVLNDASRGTVFPRYRSGTLISIVPASRARATGSENWALMTSTTLAAVLTSGL